MNATRTMLKHLLDHAGTWFKAQDLAPAAGLMLPAQAHNAPSMLAVLLDHHVVERAGTQRKYTWRVGDTEDAKARARKYLAKPERGQGRASTATPFNRGDGKKPASDPRRLPQDLPPGMCVKPSEPLAFFIDNDGDMQIVGKESTDVYIVIPKLDAVDLLEFARQCAPILEAA